MGKRGPLGDYVDNLRQSGYDDQSIQTFLASRGYNPDQIKYAMGGSNHHLTFLIAGGIIVVLLIAAITLLLLAPKQELTLQVSSGQVEVAQGGQLTFSVATNAQGAPPLLQSTVSGPQQLTATLSGSRGTIAIPADAKPGRYTVTIRTQDSTAESAFSFYVLEKKTAPSTPQNTPQETTPQETQTESQTQGQTNTAQSESNAQTNSEEPVCQLGCNDFNACTTDICDAGVCRYEDKPKPCCGDNICSDGETSVTCEADCSIREELPSTPELIQLAIDTYSADSNKALNLCAALQKIKDKDVCFSQVARSAGEVKVCSSIGDLPSRDSCLMHFVLKFNNFNVCTSLSSTLMQNSCFSLQRLKQAEAEARSAQQG